ncbi:MAG: hypothetical protein AB7P34_11120 [Vicinamibacterales bacterium]
MTTHAEPGYEFLERAHLVLFALPLSMVASILARDGVYGLRGRIVGLVAVTIPVFGVNRRLVHDAGNRRAGRWIAAWRTGVLSVLAVATLLVTLGQTAAIPGPERELLGRILFWGGLLGLAAAPALSLPMSVTLRMLLVLTGVTIALAQSCPVWRSDPERS